MLEEIGQVPVMQELFKQQEHLHQSELNDENVKANTSYDSV